MKELNLYIRPEKLEGVKKILIDEFNCGGMTILNVMGCGHQRGFDSEGKGIKTNVNLLPKIKIEVFISDSLEDALIEKLCAYLSTGHVGDGKIFVKDVNYAVRVRTGEKGESIDD